MIDTKKVFTICLFILLLSCFVGFIVWICISTAATTTTTIVTHNPVGHTAKGSNNSNQEKEPFDYIYQTSSYYQSLFSSYFTYEIDCSSTSQTLCSDIYASIVSDTISNIDNEYADTKGNVFNVTSPKLYRKVTSTNTTNTSTWLIVCGGGYFCLNWQNEIIDFVQNVSSVSPSTFATTDIFALKYSTPGNYNGSSLQSSVVNFTDSSHYYTRNTDTTKFFFSSTTTTSLLSYSPFLEFQQSIEIIANLGYTSLNIVSFSEGAHLTALMIYKYGNNWMNSIPSSLTIRTLSFHYPSFMYYSPSYTENEITSQNSTVISSTYSQPLGYFTLTYPSPTSFVSTPSININ